MLELEVAFSARIWEDALKLEAAARRVVAILGHSLLDHMLEYLNGFFHFGNRWIEPFQPGRRNRAMATLLCQRAGPFRTPLLLYQPRPNGGGLV